MAGHEQVDRRGGAPDDVDDRPADPVAVVDAERRRLGAALVQQHHDRLHAAAAQLARVAVGGVGLVEEVEPGHAGGRHDVGRPLERHADEADLDPAEALDLVGPEERPPGVLVDHVGGQEAEVGAREAGAVEAAVGGVAAAALHALELRGALVELVVAHRVEVEPDAVHRLDRRLVVEERRQQRRGADQVAGRDDQRVAVLALLLAQVRGQELRPARGHRRGAGRRRDRAGRGRLEMAVEVVQAEQLDLHVARLVPAAGGGGQDEKDEGEEEEKAG